MDGMTNRFKLALKSGAKQAGLWLSLANGYTAEVCAGAGFDWFLIDGEHAPNDLQSILAQLQAIASYPVCPVVRPPSGNPDMIKLLLDIGTQTFLIPMVETAEQASALVSALRYPPRGSRGIGHVLGRTSRWGRIADYLERSDDEVCLLVQIETRRGLDNLEAIAGIEGVDGLFIGPADLSASLGYRGQMGHPQFQAEIDRAIARIVATGKAAGTLTLGEANTRRYFSLGCSFVAAGVDVLLLTRAVDGLARAFRQPGSGNG
jgi:4-hydroxy-2-oxoheptanedioate aldolase